MNKKYALGVCLVIVILLIFVQAEPSITPGGASSAILNKCDLAQFPINDITGDQYAYGCLSETLAKSCRKSDGVIIKESFEIPAGNILLQRCGAGSTPNILVSCANPQHCREIDEVWSQIGFSVKGSGEVWDVASNSWKAFTILYPTVLSSASRPYTPPPSGENAFNEFIKEAHDTYPTVSESFIKAIIKKESNFQPHWISSTGCVGLMQVCTSSAHYQYITKMSRREITADTNLGDVPSCCEGVDCSANRVRCGGNNWCQAGEYRCSPDDDDRFDPRKNILSGTFTLKGKIDYVGNCGSDKVKAWAAAYNLGQTYVKRAVDAVGSCNSWPAVWAELVRNSDFDANTLYGDNKQYNVQSKLNNLKGDVNSAGKGDYLGEIAYTYQQYATTG